LQQSPEPVYQIEDLKVDLACRLVSLQGVRISLTPTEYDLLRLLVINAGKVLTHRMILKQIWGVAYLEQPHILRVTISNLRHKLEKDASRPRFILTESGVGYRFKSVP
jgi:two-component system KDP operon response regulator KdpE